MLINVTILHCAIHSLHVNIYYPQDITPKVITINPMSHLLCTYFIIDTVLLRNSTDIYNREVKIQRNEPICLILIIPKNSQ